MPGTPTLPLQPPIAPMLAKLTEGIPEGPGWHFEPKWDGFRCIVFFDGATVYLQSRDLKPLGRYFPELEQLLPAVLPGPLVLDGEIVIMGRRGLEFETLQQRIHPAESRVRKLSVEAPASFVAFDLLAHGGESLVGTPFESRRERLEAAFAAVLSPAYITPATRDRELAREWFERFEGAGFDGVVAKRLDGTYQPGKRVMAKINTFVQRIASLVDSAGTRARKVAALVRCCSGSTTAKGCSTTLDTHPALVPPTNGNSLGSSRRS